ncbi:MAG TPA: AtpZ/AtpI family protein [Thermoanaerobaculia bacterium]|nr:AtpZ/AtpI family protein [Thermoanaerobaculia bacterium]
MADHPRRSSSRNVKGGSNWTRLAGIGFELIAAVGAFILVGTWWDRHFGSAPKGLIVGAVLGVIGGMYNLIRQSLLATRGATAGSARTGPESPDGDNQR